MKLRDSGFEPLSKAVRPTLTIPRHQAGKCARRGTEACRNSCAYYIGRISRKQAYAVLRHMYTAMYGGSIENAAPLPVLPMVIA